jgi:hypothetical protein
MPEQQRAGSRYRLATMRIVGGQGINSPFKKKLFFGSTQ